MKNVNNFESINCTLVKIEIPVIFDPLNEQLSINNESRFALIKVVKLRQEVTK